MTDINLKDPIARGRTADVYPWDDKHILKLFHNWFKLENIEYELRIARAVHVNTMNAMIDMNVNTAISMLKSRRTRLQTSWARLKGPIPF